MSGEGEEAGEEGEGTDIRFWSDQSGTVVLHETRDLFWDPSDGEERGHVKHAFANMPEMALQVRLCLFSWEICCDAAF